MRVSDVTVLKRKIRTERGLDCDQFKPNFFVRRVAARLRHTDQPTIREYIRLLDREPAECERLLGALSINVTQFFRDQSTFRLIRAKLLPGLLAANAAGRRRSVKVWSAGCASGQEAYSLAILLAEALEHGPEGIMARVYGTDIAPRALRDARRGVYGATEMEGVARAFALRHFEANGNYRVSPGIRQLVRFRVHDLLRDPPLRHVDLLVCRNVLIYLSSSRDARARLFDIFDAALRPGGFLVLGKTEAVGTEVKGRFTLVDIKERVYQKPVAVSVHGGR